MRIENQVLSPEICPFALSADLEESQARVGQRLTKQLRARPAIFMMTKNDFDLGAGFHAGHQAQRAFPVFFRVAVEFDDAHFPLIAVDQVVSARSAGGFEGEIGEEIKDAGFLDGDDAVLRGADGGVVEHPRRRFHVLHVHFLHVALGGRCAELGLWRLVALREINAVDLNHFREGW